jgi:hypothetical protein
LVYSTTDFGKVATDFAYVGLFAVVVAAIGIALSWRYLSK